MSARKDGVLATRSVQVSTGGDLDGDGLPDDYELDNGLDPNDPVDAFEDQDGDGLSALEEYNAGTDVHLADTDGDGIEDGEELAEGEDGVVTNPLLADSDGDGLRDGVEIAVGSDPNDASDADFDAAVVSLNVSPAAGFITFNMIDGEVSLQLRAELLFIDDTTLDVTSGPNGASYASSDLTIASFGLDAGEVFGGQNGTATITVSAFGRQVEVPVTVESFDPTPVSRLGFSGSGQDTDVLGNYVFIAADSGGLHVADVTDRANPVLVATVLTSGPALDVVVSDSVAYVAVGSAGLDLIDISNPEEPTLIQNVNTGGTAGDIELNGRLAYLGLGAFGVLILDVSDPAAPFELGSVRGLGDVVGVDVQLDRLVVATSSSIQIVDVANPAAPIRLGSVSIGNTQAVQIDGDYAYVAAYTAGYKVVDLSDPMAPRIIPGDTRFYPTDVALTDGFAFFAELLFVNAVPYVNIRNPEQSVFQGAIDISQFGDRDAYGLSVDSTHIYSTGGTYLYISQYRLLQDEQGLAPQVEIVAPEDGDVVIEGGRFLFRAEASDDIAVAKVDFFVDETFAFSDSTRPYEFWVEVPSSLDELELRATAADLGENSASDSVGLLVQPDSDGDGLGDEEEANTLGTDPNDPDTDGDGLDDKFEVDRGMNPLAEDSDADGVADGAEILAETDPLNPDVTPPMILSTDPADGEQTVSENAAVSVVLSEPLLPKSFSQGSLLIFENGNKAVDGVVELINGNTELLFTPSGLMKNSTDHTITVSGVRDEAGNPLPGIFEATFATGDEVDLERPSLELVSPQNNATYVPVNALITLVFNERINPVTVTDETLYVIDRTTGLRIEGLREVAPNKRSVTFFPNTSFFVGARARNHTHGWHHRLVVERALQHVSAVYDCLCG